MSVWQKRKRRKTRDYFKLKKLKIFACVTRILRMEMFITEPLCLKKKKQWSAKRYHWKSRKMRQKCTIEFLNVNKDNQWNRGEKSTRKKIHNTKVWIWDLRDGLEIKCYSGRGENPSWVPAPTWWLRTVSWLQVWHPLLVSVGIRHEYLTHTYVQSNIHIHKNTP